ncbi:hypothetical protein ACFV3F_03435 [Streptomyces sp. NPDC059717]|uniref:hypothetical protein n=1 Tax=Streptomyces sp. NPDC059717 TaxID=3346922 RepID=UPI0036764544
MTPPESTAVAVELERLRGAVDTGFATLNGRLDVALQRTSTAESDITDLKADVEALKRNRWPLPALAALTGAGGLAVSVWQAIGR